MKDRILIKHDTSENWAKAVNFIPLAGELILYDGIFVDGKYVEIPKLKVGDGMHNVNDLPFISNNSTQKVDYIYNEDTLILS